MTQEVQFDEERPYFSKLKRQDEIPQKGIEGWVYNKLPGKYSYKKNLLILLILVFFGLTFVFFVLGIQNLGETPGSAFIDRVDNTRSK